MEGTDPLVLECRARIGQQIHGKYRLDALIGIGGMAAVYMATHRNGSVAAIKLLHPEVALMTEIRERFLREAYIANKVGHEGTVKVLDDDVDDQGVPFLVMELLQGQPLDVKAEQRDGRLSVDDTLDILDQTLAVLESAHRNQIIHRDLKPENLFLTSRGQVKVLDFGIARLREDSARKTQTGMVMGTPSFMAPEQAMGRIPDVDARTDIYAMGATAFTLLSGEAVHEVESAGEMLVAAATRHARSLARALPDASFSLIALIDKALSYERGQRYQNAESFRAEVQRVRQELLGGESEREAPKLMPQARATGYAASHDATLAAESITSSAPAVESKDSADPEFQTFDPCSATPRDIAALTEVFVHLERALVATKQYGSDHPEPKRRFADTFRLLSSALLSAEQSTLAWNLSPYGFNISDHSLWEPEAPWNRIPYQLFSDGVRTMGFGLGISEDEFARWLQLVTLDPTTDLPLEDDLVTKLWDSDFQHAYHQAIDSFAEGNQEDRAAYELRRKRVLDQAVDLDEAALADAWQQEHGASAMHGDAAQQSATVLRFLSGGDALSKATAARVKNLSLVDPTDVDADDARRALALDRGTQQLLAARLDPEVSATSDRFVLVAAHAYATSSTAGDSSMVTAPLRRALSGLSESGGEQALDMLLDLRGALQHVGGKTDGDVLFGQLAVDIMDGDILARILQSIASRTETSNSEVALETMRSLLPDLGPPHFAVFVSFVAEGEPSQLRTLLLDYLLTCVAGHELALANLFASADFETSMLVLKALAQAKSAGSKEALRRACDSPHALVRIEALGLMEGAGGVELKRELRKLLGDPLVEVRLAALQAMQKHEITAAGPYLVVRIQEPDFHKLPIEERRQSLRTLRTLRVQRCEELCIELLGDVSWVRSREVEATRELAAQLLGKIARTDAALFALEKTASSHDPRQTRAVKEAAKEALLRLAERVEAAERQRTSRQQQSGPQTSTTASRHRSGVPPRPKEA